jgi:hypothetical protein
LANAVVTVTAGASLVQVTFCPIRLIASWAIAGERDIGIHAGKIGMVLNQDEVLWRLLDKTTLNGALERGDVHNEDHCTDGGEKSACPHRTR